MLILQRNFILYVLNVVKWTSKSGTGTQSYRGSCWVKTGQFLWCSLFGPRRIGRSSHTALRSECESFCHVSDYFSVWSGIFENFHLVFSSWIWCYRTEKVKMNFFPLSSFFLSNFGGNEKVCNTRNPAYLWWIYLKRLARYFSSRKLIPKTLSL